MKLTPEQKAQVERERLADPYKYSFDIELTPEQRVALQQAQSEEGADRQSTIAEMERLDALLEEDSFLGSLRRAIDSADRPWADLERDSDVPARRIEQFVAGLADLSQSDIDRLVTCLHLQLVPTTMATSSKS